MFYCAFVSCSFVHSMHFYSPCNRQVQCEIWGRGRSADTLGRTKRTWTSSHTLVPSLKDHLLSLSLSTRCDLGSMPCHLWDFISTITISRCNRWFWRPLYNHVPKEEMGCHGETCKPGEGDQHSAVSGAHALTCWHPKPFMETME